LSDLQINRDPSGVGCDVNEVALPGGLADRHLALWLLARTCARNAAMIRVAVATSLQQIYFAISFFNLAFSH
jgi:hypothetical protein